MISQRFKLIMWIVIILMMTAGGVLGIYLTGAGTGEFHYEIAIAISAGAIFASLVTFLLSKRHKKKNGNVPEIDERSMMLMQRYLIGVLYVVLFGSGAILIVLYAMGIEFIETGMIIVYMMVLFILIGIGALVVKRL